ncbi:HesA/MoeB/ThiF family protein [Anoxynatronum buryatiense]|uniref:Molybdopterin or thiamine biosynthesis adenylyltransferase n=1 Tax=Anoxynatronum buryatiense TaxID=489973 RepID=A0AA46AIT1_9CLOT|nr:HesA/MoeB/ThiF family protein [Anoxynatronum buryatiense]SMP53870.1 Molybdopterin or thiamine biosynthesis adenylyltransferase [Anoxynatronum buryatiense]
MDGQWKEIDESIRRGSRVIETSQNQRYKSIVWTTLLEIQKQFDVSVHILEIRCLAQGIIPEKYVRNIRAIGTAGQTALIRSRIGIAGAGGLGGHVAELAARMGFGSIVCVDGDDFEESNLNRQTLSRYDLLGTSKADAAVGRIREINPAVEAVAVAMKCTAEDFINCFKDCQLLMDCLDSSDSRNHLMQAAVELNIPWIHGAVAGFRGQVMTVFPEDQRVAGLMRVSQDGKGAEKVMGTPSASPAMVAAWQVQEAIKVITGKGTLIRNRMLIMDAYQGTVQTIEV